MSILVLATWESLIGTLTPLAFFPHEVFTHFPYALSLEGQYIIKNLVLISAGVMLRATLRGGDIVPDPARAHRPAAIMMTDGVAV